MALCYNTTKTNQPKQLRTPTSTIHDASPTYLNHITFHDGTDQFQCGAGRLSEAGIDLEPGLSTIGALYGGKLPIAGLDGADDANDHTAVLPGH